MNKRIGVVGQATLFDSDDMYKDVYTFQNNYAKRVYANDGVPVGILPIDGHVPVGELLACGGFLLCGGHKIWPYHLQVIDHAWKTGKPILGICLGMQAINAYFTVRHEIEERAYNGTVEAMFEQMKQERFLFNQPVEHHWDVAITRHNIPDTKHRIAIQPGTMLHDLLGVDTANVVTLHRYRISDAAPGVTVSATALDGAIEAIEAQNNVLGVQFHPEHEEELDALFKYLVDTAQ